MNQDHADSRADAFVIGETPVHPGDILKRELAALNVRPAELSRQIDVPANRITQIMKGLRGITGDTALRLGHWFENDPRFWMNLQSAYDIQLAAQEAGRTIEALPTKNTQTAGQETPAA